MSENMDNNQGINNIQNVQESVIENKNDSEKILGEIRDSLVEIKKILSDISNNTNSVHGIMTLNKETIEAIFSRTKWMDFKLGDIRSAMFNRDRSRPLNVGLGNPIAN